MSTRYVHIRKFSTEQDDDHIWNMPEKTNVGDRFGPWGVKEPLLSWHISVLDRHGAQTELILRWDVCDQVLGEMKDIIYKCSRYRAESDTLRFPAG